MSTELEQCALCCIGKDVRDEESESGLVCICPCHVEPAKASAEEDEDTSEPYGEFR